MKRKRLTQLFPWLLPLRIWQRKLCFYAQMRFDGRRYAKTVTPEPLPYMLFSANSALYNSETGFDMVYQHNKVHNLRLAAKTLNGLLIYPGETFSFWRLVRMADKREPYRDGLVVVDGQLVTARGGGLCQLSNLLFWLFLNSPLTVTERYGHKVKDFPTPQSAEPEGADATVREGWLDLKVTNETDTAFQIIIGFENDYITSEILSDKPAPCGYTIEGRNLLYFRKGSKVYEHVSIYRNSSLLYDNVCEIGYPLPADTIIYEGDV